MADYKRKMGIEEDKDSPLYNRESLNRETYKPSKYDSIRSAGEEERLSKRKSEGLKQAAMGAGLAPVSIAFETAMGRSDTRGKGPIGAGATHLAGTGDRFAKSVKEAADFIGGGVRKYKNAKSEEADLDTELDSQTKRETRGKAKGGMTKAYAKGGKVSSASSRADGIAQRGKTKGKYL